MFTVTNKSMIVSFESKHSLYDGTLTFKMIHQAFIGYNEEGYMSIDNSSLDLCTDFEDIVCLGKEIPDNSYNNFLKFKSALKTLGIDFDVDSENEITKLLEQNGGSKGILSKLIWGIEIADRRRQRLTKGANK